MANKNNSSGIPRFGSAKINLPRQPSDLLHRQRLLDFLHEHIRYKLTLVCAAAGYGKSSLLIDFAHDTDYPVAWCSLDESDGDLAVLVTDLIAALRVPFPALITSLLDLITQSGITPIELAKTLAHDVEIGIEEYFVLALDDFHRIQDSSGVAAFFDALLANLPEQAHLLIASRALPPFRIVQLAARQQIAGLSEEHLRFTAIETQSLIQSRNSMDIPEAEAEKLAANTEGWITGILLTSHLMWQGLMANLMRAQQSDSPVYEYLVEEVLEHQPEWLRQFLMESAVLPEMEPAVCDAVLDRSDSGKLLQEAENRRLFVSAVGDEFRTYQYHHLFRDFLLARLREQAPDRLKMLQNRAADSYAANGMPEAAITFYIAAGELMKAAQLAESNATSMFLAGRQATLKHWSDQLISVALEMPRLHLHLATAQTDVGQLDEAEKTLGLAVAAIDQRADQASAVEAKILQGFILYKRGKFDQALELLQNSVPVANEAGQSALVALALRYIGLCLGALGKLAAAEEAFQRAVDLLQSPRYWHDRAWALTDLATVLFARGQIVRSSQAQQAALEIWRKRPAPGPLAVSLNNMGLLMHMAGQYESSLNTYREALEWAGQTQNSMWQAPALTGQADLLADLGEHESARELYRQAMVGAESGRDWSLLVYICRAMARLARWEHDYSNALQWLQRAEFTLEQMPESRLLTLVRGLRGVIFVETDHISDGYQLLTEACAELEVSGAPADLVQNLLFRAYAEFRMGEHERAAQSIAYAMEIANQVGYNQMLVSEARSVREMLETFSHRSDIGSRVVSLLSKAETGQVSKLNVPQVRTTSSRPTPADSFTLEVYALGPVRILKNGTEISRPEWTSQRPRELFLFLVDRSPIARDKVLEVFWPDKSLARAASNLYQTLYRLRHALGDEIIVLSDQECRLSERITLTYDVARFEAQAKSALALPRGDLRRLGGLADASQSYTGRYLSDLPVDWAQTRAEALAKLYVAMLREYAVELMDLTRYSEAKDVLTKALVVEPFQDELHGQMLICLARLGRRHEVIDYYRHYRDTLRTELGLDPPIEIRQLYSQLIG